jgi:hypothetical protein
VRRAVASSDTSTLRPRAFFSANPKSITLNWIDSYRQ